MLCFSVNLCSGCAQFSKDNRRITNTRGYKVASKKVAGSSFHELNY
jgi:hypothetical protein